MGKLEQDTDTITPTNLRVTWRCISPGEGTSHLTKCLFVGLQWKINCKGELTAEGRRKKDSNLISKEAQRSANAHLHALSTGHTESRILCKENNHQGASYSQLAMTTYRKADNVRGKQHRTISVNIPCVRLWGENITNIFILLSVWEIR
jgi:hypothetical protein